MQCNCWTGPPEPHAHGAQVIELNLLLADWYDENHRQSLLYKTNAKWAREMLYNTR